MTTQFNNKVGTLFNSLKRKLFEENEENYNNIQYTSTTTTQPTNINTNIPIKKKRNKYYYNQQHQQQQKQNRQQQQKQQKQQQQQQYSFNFYRPSIFNKLIIPDFNLHDIVTSVKSYLFTNSNNNKTFSLFHNPFISNNNSSENNQNNQNYNNNLDNKRTAAKRLPKSKISNRKKRNSLTVPNHFHINLTMNENNSNSNNNENNNNNNENNNNNDNINNMVNSLNINDNDNNITQYDSDDDNNNLYLSDKPQNQSFVDYIQSQKENDDFNESVNVLINDYSSLSVESQIKSPQTSPTTTTTTTTTATALTSTTTTDELISPSKSKFSDYQYFNNNSPSFNKKLSTSISPKSRVSPFSQQHQHQHQQESIPFSLEELKSDDNRPIFIESDDEDSFNDNKETVLGNEESNYLNKSTQKSLISSFRPKETPSFENLINQIEQNDDNVFWGKMEKQVQKERDDEIGSLLQKLQSLSSSSNKYNLFKTIEERMEMEKKKKPTLRQLTKDENQTIDDIFRNGRPDDLISELPLAEVKRSDLRLLLPGKWLNDEVINFYMEVLKIRDLEKKKNSGGDFPKCHFFNTFFYPKLCNDNHTYNYEKVRRWTARVNLFEMDKIIIPIHLGNHWCLAVINFKAKQFEYYDSLLGSNKECLTKLRKYISDEMQNKSKQGAVNLDEFKDFMPKEIPIQQNGYDCGVFMCKYAEFCSKGANLTFTQEEITQYRRRMVLEISKKQIID
ncbi:hypothetical protein RB653_004006 [Dictyostelium firmibasis]|uniref:Ubiquitin-like protease family profile domain-containing protein n=1 Tax=Dictyostelium firmibasis TaxID=79012 RepID=A0AAN7YWM7_9MYCE